MRRVDGVMMSVISTNPCIVAEQRLDRRGAAASAARHASSSSKRWPKRAGTGVDPGLERRFDDGVVRAHAVDRDAARSRSTSLTQATSPSTGSARTRAAGEPLSPGGTRRRVPRAAARSTDASSCRASVVAASRARIDLLDAVRIEVSTDVSSKRRSSTSKIDVGDRDGHGAR